MGKTCLIRQPAGIGDIMFCQKIGEYYKSSGYNVIWPVASVYSYLSDYMDNFQYPLETSDFPYKYIFNDLRVREIVETPDFVFLPLHEHNPRDYSVMCSKYKLALMDYSDWYKYFTFRRNHKKEDQLFYDLLNLKDGDEFIFVNNNYGSPPNFLRKNIKLDTDKRIITMDFIENFTVFDWCKVLELAKEIHTTETCLNYLIEILNIRHDFMFMYSKHTPASYTHVSMLFNDKWKYMY